MIFCHYLCGEYMMDINYVIFKAFIMIVGIAVGYYGRILYRNFINNKRGGGAHRWSGWPGAFCMYCGVEDRLEIALGEGYFDPCTGKWDSRKHKREYTNKPCPFVPKDVDPYSLPYPLPKDRMRLV